LAFLPLIMFFAARVDLEALLPDNPLDDRVRVILIRNPESPPDADEIPVVAQYFIATECDVPIPSTNRRSLASPSSLPIRSFISLAAFFVSSLLAGRMREARRRGCASCRCLGQRGRQAAGETASCWDALGIARRAADVAVRP